MRLAACALLLLATRADGGWPKLRVPKLPWQKSSARTECTDGGACRETPASATCDAAIESCASQDATARSAAGLYEAPATGQFVIDPANLLSAPLREGLLANLTKFNRTKNVGLQTYLAVYSRIPQDEEKVLTPREFARRLLRSWFVKTEKVVLIVLLVDHKRMEIAMGSKGKRKLKDSAARRIARKVQAKLPGQPDVAARLAVKDVTAALGRDKGLVGSLRSVLMPVIVVLVLGFMYLKNQSARQGAAYGGMDGGGFGGDMMPGMPGMGGGMDGMDGGMGGGFGGMMGGMGGGAMRGDFDGDGFRSRPGRPSSGASRPAFGAGGSHLFQAGGLRGRRAPR